MKISYTVKFTLEMHPNEYLGSTPKEHLQEMFEEDPAHLFEESEVEKFTVGPVIREETTDEDEDDEDLHELDSEGLDLD